MLPQTLIDYLKTSKEQGFSLNVIEEALRTQGWDDPTIQKAKEWYVNQSEPIPPSMQPLINKKTEEEGEHKPFVFVKEAQSSDSSNTIFGMNEKPSAKSPKMVLIACVGIIGALILFFSTSMVLIAYGAIRVGDTAFRRNVSNIVLSIPFMPKTAEYVLIRSTEVGQDVKRLTVDASFALNSPSLAKSLGVGGFDLSIKGPIDYQDPQNPSLSFTIAMAKDFDLDIRMKNKTTYFRINQFPSFVSLYTVMLGISDEVLQQFTKKWFSYDSKALETEARNNLNEKESGVFTQKDTERLMIALTEDKIKKHITMTIDTLNGKKMYKIHLNATSDVINNLEKALQKESDKNAPSATPRIKASEYIKDMVVDEWVDTNDYNLHKIAIAFTIKSPQTDAFLMPSQGNNYDMPRLSNEEIPMSLVIKFSDYGKAANIEIPKDAVNFEEYLKTTLETIQASEASTIRPKSAL